jgi:hypothetical protein
VSFVDFLYHVLPKDEANDYIELMKSMLPQRKQIKLNRIMGWSKSMRKFRSYGCQFRIKSATNKSSPIACPFAIDNGIQKLSKALEFVSNVVCLEDLQILDIEDIGTIAPGPFSNAADCISSCQKLFVEEKSRRHIP